MTLLMTWKRGVSQFECLRENRDGGVVEEEKWGEVLALLVPQS
jgi:hypothetical protein